jgi:hypothetical protein
MTGKKRILVCILAGAAIDNKKAAAISDFFKKCTFCVVSTSKDNNIYTVLTVPADHKWWVETIREKPYETVGLEKTEVFYLEDIEVKGPWSAGEVKPELDKPPCGAACLTCPVYKKACPGCPATKHYTKKN